MQKLIPKKRLKRIELNTYRKHLKWIRQQAKELGFELKMYTYKIPKYQYELRNKCGGWCDESKGIITVYQYGRAGRLRKLHTALHELRHAIHYKKGSYPNYYQHLPKWHLYFENGGKKPLTTPKPSMAVAVKAEQNCNDYARKILKKWGYDFPYEKYPKYWTLTSRFYQQKRSMKWEW